MIAGLGTPQATARRDSQERLTRGCASDKHADQPTNYMPKSNAEMTAKRQISPATWKARVAQVPRAYRCEVAHIVWWDWFGGRIATERWSHLDHYLKRPVWNKPTDEELVHGLMLCGYSQKHAISRIGNKGNKGQSKA